MRLTASFVISQLFPFPLRRKRQRQLPVCAVALRPVRVQALKFAHRIARKGDQRDAVAAEVHRRQHDDVAECMHIAAPVRLLRRVGVDAEQQKCLHLVVEAVSLPVHQNGVVVLQGQSRRLFVLRGIGFFLRLRLRRKRLQIRRGSALAEIFPLRYTCTASALIPAARTANMQTSTRHTRLRRFSASVQPPPAAPGLSVSAFVPDPAALAHFSPSVPAAAGCTASSRPMTR